MAQVKTGGTEVARYIYDALGRRISATSGGVTRVSLYLGNDIVYETGGGTITKYVVAGGKYLAKVVTQAQAGAAGTLGAAAVVTPPVEPPDGSTSTSTSTKTPPGYIPPPDDLIMIIELPIIYPPPPDEPPPGEEPPPQEPPPSEPQPPSLYGVFYFHTDLEGSIRAVTDSQGQVVARYEYEPFGLTVKAEGPLAGHDVHKFTGKPEDAAIGLYYFGARYYDPEAGRFISQDPLGDGLNLYVYCYQNPLRYVDPAGLRPLDNPGGSHDDPETDDDLSTSTDYMGDTLGSYLEGVRRRETILRVISFAVDWIPYAGDAKGIIEAFYGRDLITHEELSWLCRLLGLVCMTELKGVACNADEIVGLVARNADEIHHLLPKQFESYFKAAGLNIDDFTMTLPRWQHRLKHFGIHCGPENWNKQWKRFFTERPDRTAGEIMDQLNRMMKQFGLR